MDNVEFQQQAENIERLVQRVSNLQDADARACALELMQAVMDLHGSGITRVVEVLSESGETGRASLSALGKDPLVCGLLVLYGVHPASQEERVSAAVEKIAPQIRKQSGSVDLLAVDDGIVRVSVQSSGNGCHSSPDALKTMIEQAIREAAPEILQVVFDGITSPASGFVPLNMLQPIPSEGKTYEESAA